MATDYKSVVLDQTSIRCNSLDIDEDVDVLELHTDSNDYKSKKSWSLSAVKLMIGVIVVLSFIMISERTGITTLSTSTYTTTNFDETSSSYTISIQVASPTYGVPASISMGMLPWDALAEPHKENTLSVSEFLLNDDDKTTSLDSTYTVTWTLDGVTYTGNDASITLTDVGIYDGTVTITSGSSNSMFRRLTGVVLPGMTSSSVSYTYDFTVACKYIRREIRSLTDEDRTTFFDALQLMYTTSEDDGRSLYGAKFNTAEYFSYKHLTGAGTTDCDHWHDGAGIVTHHMAFTLEVEQTLQSIDPSIAMPYWEYGMDTYLYDSWSDSPIFDADWFGESSPVNDLHKISDGGRWDGVQVPDGDSYSSWSIADTGTLNPYVNGFGHMRSPWNNNPIQYIGRHNKTYGVTQYDSMPTCSTLSSCFKSDSLADINDCSNGATHGPVHILIGGAWGEGTLFDDDDVTMVQMPDKLLFFKVLWRMGYSRCPDTCTLGTPCKCAVPDEYINEYGAEYILKATNIYYGVEKYLTDADDELYTKILRAVEDPGIAGDMFSSAAAFDPSFWPLHGQIERLLSYKRILISQGEITDFDETWAFTEYNKASGAAYLDGVCDWSKVAGSGDLTLPTCTLDTICTGHNENDLLEFHGFLNSNDAYTNAEFYDLIHPWNDEIPYTYDTFDFDYCTDQGSSFTSTTTDPSSSMLPTDGSMLPNVPGMLPTVPTVGGKRRQLRKSNARRTMKHAKRTMTKEELLAQTNSLGQMLANKARAQTTTAAL